MEPIQNIKINVVKLFLIWLMRELDYLFKMREKISHNKDKFRIAYKDNRKLEKMKHAIFD